MNRIAAGFGLSMALASTSPPPLSGPSAGAPVSVSGVERRIDVDTDLKPEVEGCVRARAVIRVEAAPAAVRDAILDLHARVEESWIVESVEVYLDQRSATSIRRAATWTLGVMGVGLVYHTIYEWDAESQAVVWRLDPDRDHDLRRAIGIYELRAIGKHTELVYMFEIGTKRRVPLSLRRRLTRRTVHELLDSIRTRAEAG